MPDIILYAAPLSLYSAKVRSYLIKAGIAYREVTSADPRYKSVVRPQAGTATIPVIETSNGEIIRDGTRIVDYLDSSHKVDILPQGPRQKIVSRLFEVIGSEGLLRPAMHYRWDFADLNADFIRVHFEALVPAELDRTLLAGKTMQRMQNAGQMFGAIAENFEIIEQLYETLLVKFDAHFKDYPYLLGNKPCIGDFGLMGPLYAHLGRDPKPLQLMQAKACRLFRWVERMNRPEADIGEFESRDTDAYIDADEIPSMLIELMAHIARDFVPETAAAVEYINQWLEEKKPPPGTPIVRGVGSCAFEVEGQTFKALAQPYRFFLLKRMQAEYDAVPRSTQQDIDRMLEQANMRELLTCRLDREIGWKDNLEVWL